MYCQDCNKSIKEKFILTATKNELNVLCITCLAKNGTKGKTRHLETEFFPLQSLLHSKD